MLTGKVEVDGRLVLFAEFVDRRDMEYGGAREVASESVAALLAGGMPLPEACGFRFFTRIVASATVGGRTVELRCPHVETGPRYLIGELVSREYLVSRAADPPSFGIRGLDGTIRSLDGKADGRVIRFGPEDRHYRVIGPEDKVIDANGNPVAEVTGPPEGWVQPTEFVGHSFVVEVIGRLIRTSVRDCNWDDRADVRLEISNPDGGLLGRIHDAARTHCPGKHGEPGDGWCDICNGSTSDPLGRTSRPGIRVAPRDGTISFEDRPESMSMEIDLGEGRMLSLTRNGTKLTVILACA